MDQRNIKPGRYRHFKGSEYQVIDVAYHSETQELMVLYRPLYGEGKLWVRPYDMFTEKVPVDGTMVDRFSFVSDSQPETN
nr:DUF1653 domain-containing protein [Aliikangiella sp. G2MR2-5]